MKIFQTLVYTVLIAMSSTTFAMGGGGNNATSNSSSNGTAIQGQSLANSPTTNLSNVDARVYNSTVKASDLGKMVPNVMAPSLTTTLTETCMGSTSFGGSGSGFGFSFGTTWRDSACVRRLDSRQLAAFNDMGTAREIMCASTIVREAAKRAGRPCVADGGLPAYQLAQPQQQVQAPHGITNREPTDQEVAAIMALQPDQDKTTNAVNALDPSLGPMYRVETPVVD